MGVLIECTGQCWPSVIHIRHSGTRENVYGTADSSQALYCKGTAASICLAAGHYTYSSSPSYTVNSQLGTS
jgi:hypothetical protein